MCTILLPSYSLNLDLHQGTPSAEDYVPQPHVDQPQQVSESLEFSLVFETDSVLEENTEEFDSEDSEEEFTLQPKVNDDDSSSEAVCRTVITML